MDKPISPPDVQRKVESTMVDSPISGHDSATEHESTMVDDPTPRHGPAAVHESTMVHDLAKVDDPISGHDSATDHESTMVDSPISGHGPATEHECTTAERPAPRPGGEEEPLLTSLDDIPDEIEPRLVAQAREAVGMDPCGPGAAPEKAAAIDLTASRMVDPLPPRPAHALDDIPEPPTTHRLC